MFQHDALQRHALDAVKHGLHTRHVLLHGLHAPVPAQGSWRVFSLISMVSCSVGSCTQTSVLSIRWGNVQQMPACQTCAERVSEAEDALRNDVVEARHAKLLCGYAMHASLSTVCEPVGTGEDAPCNDVIEAGHAKLLDQEPLGGQDLRDGHKAVGDEDVDLVDDRHA